MALEKHMGGLPLGLLREEHLFSLCERIPSSRHPYHFACVLGTVPPLPPTSLVGIFACSCSSPLYPQVQYGLKPSTLVLGSWEAPKYMPHPSFIGACLWMSISKPEG